VLEDMLHMLSDDNGAINMVNITWDTVNNGGNVDEGEVERRMREGSE